MRLAVVVLGFALLVVAPPPVRADDDPVSAVIGADRVGRRGAGEALVRRFVEDRETLERAFAVPMSTAWLDRQDRFLAAWEAGLALGFTPPQPAGIGDLPGWGPDADDQRDLVLLRTEIGHLRRDIGFQRGRIGETVALAPFATDLVALEESRRRMETVAPQAAADRLDAAKKALDAVKAKVEKGVGKKPEDANADTIVVTPSAALRASQQLGALHGALRTWFGDRDGYEPEFGWWVRKPWQALDGALGEYEKLLREKVAGVTDDSGANGGAIVGDPIGADALRAELDHEFIPYTPQEILAIADREMAWCVAEAKKAAAEMGFGDDWKKALAKVKQNHVQPGMQDELVAAQAREAIEFLDARDLVTIPQLCRETWGEHMIPEQGQRFTPFAYYSGGSMGVAFPTEGMDHDRKLMSMRQNNTHFSRNVTPHELIPGHHLQLFQADRHRPYRGLFRTPFLVEGWALYWEMRFWDLGWAKSPEDRFGMLFWRMHRCARITVTTKFHLGEMTPQQMIDFLVDKVGHERDGATGEVRRFVSGGYGPLYQMAYMLGGIQLRALHRELVGTGPGKMTERAFHDAVLRENSIPVRIIRAALTGESVGGPGGVAPWRFAE